MKIRRYMGKNAQEAILKVKMDLGNDAIIISTRKIRQKGLMYLFSKPLVEILAAIDDHDEKKEEATKDENKNKFVTDLKIANKQKDEKIEALESKVSGIETLLNKIYEQISKDTKNLIKEENVDLEDKVGSITDKVLQLFSTNMIKNDVEPEIAKKIIDNIKIRIDNLENKDITVAEISSMLVKEISQMLGKPKPIELSQNQKPSVVVFVGPTGVGKTTTIAKVAANFVLNEKKKVGLITADTYRIAAVEQLKTYAEILGTPITVIYSLNEVQDALNRHKDNDVILLDTAGRSHKNKKHFEELKNLIQECNPDEIYLLVSATTKTKDCKDIINSYSFIQNYKLLFTKLDETSSLGLILNVKQMTNKSLSYVTIGQSVPDDIETANVERITKSLLGSIST